VPPVGSDAWIEAFAARAAGSTPAATSRRLVVQQEVTDSGAAWFVVVGDGAVVVERGHHPEPDVTFSQDAATAAAVNAGTLPAQQAFIEGRLRVRGSVERLVDAAAALAALPAVEA
jgi:predicted lipid carrier protein YhbT